jgi:uncharacterized spore protein YtfJ
MLMSEQRARAELDPELVKRVYGERIKCGDTEIIPVAAVRSCGRSGKDGGDGCGCVSARPIGIVVLRDGDAEWKPAIDVNRVALTLVAGLGLVALLLRRLRG